MDFECIGEDGAGEAGYSHSPAEAPLLRQRAYSLLDLLPRFGPRLGRNAFASWYSRSRRTISSCETDIHLAHKRVERGVRLRAFDGFRFGLHVSTVPQW